MGEILQELPTIHTLTKRWFSLHFPSREPTNLILSQFWHIEMAPVLLKWQNPLFDLDRELLGAGPIWVWLPGLPLHLRNEHIFKHIGNFLGTYLDHDRSFIDSGKMAFACILVHLDTREGLEEAINIQCCNSPRVQILDYEGVPL